MMSKQVKATAGGKLAWPAAESRAEQSPEQRVTKAAGTQDTAVDRKLRVHCYPLSTERDSCTPVWHARDYGMGSRAMCPSAHLEPGLLLC